MLIPRNEDSGDKHSFAITRRRDQAFPAARARARALAGRDIRNGPADRDKSEQHDPIMTHRAHFTIYFAESYL